MSNNWNKWALKKQKKNKRILGEKKILLKIWGIRMGQIGYKFVLAYMYGIFKNQKLTN